LTKRTQEVIENRGQSRLAEPERSLAGSTVTLPRL
jgi:hypothetical protein